MRLGEIDALNGGCDLAAGWDAIFLDESLSPCQGQIVGDIFVVPLVRHEDQGGAGQGIGQEEIGEEKVLVPGQDTLGRATIDGNGG